MQVGVSSGYVIITHLTSQTLLQRQPCVRCKTKKKYFLTLRMSKSCRLTSQKRAVTKMLASKVNVNGCFCTAAIAGHTSSPFWPQRLYLWYYTLISPYTRMAIDQIYQPLVSVTTWFYNHSYNHGTILVFTSTHYLSFFQYLIWF